MSPAAASSASGSKNHRTALYCRQADSGQLPFEDLSFYAACISFALHEMPASVRGRVLAEMVRVTRPGSPIIIVDYGLPSNRIIRWLAFHIVRAYEGKPYVHFMATDLVALTGSAGIHVVERQRGLGGLGRILIGTRAGNRPGEAGAAGRRNP